MRCRFVDVVVGDRLVGRLPRTVRARVAALLGVGAALVLCLASVPAKSDEAAVDFATTIQPLFIEHCYQCHGPDKQEAGLRLDQRAKALAGGDSGAWFVAGKSAESEIIHRLSATDDERMPPGPENKPLAPDAIAAIKKWINAGAHWPEPKNGSSHWAYQALNPAPIPTVQNQNWPRNPIDHFVLARLEARGLAPSPEADRYTLIKRLAYDLWGLPPSVAEVDAFVGDLSPDAYERLVDRLLDSPHFGERWGRHWLDKARYADSDGYEKDNPRPDAWRYREWVIDAVNSDLPLDQFTLEQLAGDLLPDATPLQRLATAFHRQTLTNTEGGADPEQFRVEAIFDRIATTGAVWLGLTVGCAQCHTHKYDAITHQEYYQLFAFFNNGDETDAEVPMVGEALSKWQHDRDKAADKLAKLKPKLDAKRAELIARLPAWEAELKQTPVAPLAFHPVELVSAASSAGADLKILSDGSYLVSGKNSDVDKLTVTAKTDLKQVTGFRLEALPHDSLGGRGPGRTPHGNFVLGEFRAFAAPNDQITKEHRVDLSHAQADYAQNGFTAENAIDGKEPTGWSVGGEIGREHALLVITDKPIDTSARPWLQLVLSQNFGTQHTLGRFRLSAVTGHDPMLGIPANIRELLALPLEQRTPEQTAALSNYYVNRDSKAKELAAEIKQLQARVDAPPTMRARVIAQRTEKPRKSHILHRGDFLDPQAEVTPGTLAVLPALKPRGAMPDRLDLARWLISPENSLARRVMANQLWSHLFGRGIVRTANDFGVRGDRPTHPELLDWLAGQLAERKWSRKELIRLIVSSATYRQVSTNRPELADSDPLNDLFHRQNRFRIEGEAVRDVTLAVAGLLAEKVGGPSVFPPLPADIAELSYANNFKWATSKGEDRYRRGMYTFFKRTAPHPNLTTFDCPDSNTTCVERRLSNTPLQALATLNNESFVEASQAMAARVLALPATTDAERLTLALRWGIARPPVAAELAAFSELLTESRTWYATHAAEAAQVVGPFKPTSAPVEEAAAWVSTTRMMLNLDEFLTRE